MTEPPGPRPRRRARPVIGAIAAGGAVVLIGIAIYRQRDGFSDGLARLEWWAIAGSILSAVIALCASGLAWRSCLTLVAPDHSLPLRPAAGVFFLSQLGKYVPGSVWPVLAQMELTRRYGLPRTASGMGMLVTMLVGIVTSGCVGVGALAVANAHALETYWFVIPMLVAGAAALTPPVLAPSLRMLGRLVRRPVPTSGLTWSGLAPAVLWSFAAWPAFGLHAWFIASQVSDGDASFSQSTGAFALAWLVGFLVFFAPAGVGAREGVLIVAFSGSLATAEALAFAVVSRLVLTLVDAAAGGAGFVLRRRSGAAPAPPV